MVYKTASIVKAYTSAVLGKKERVFNNKVLPEKAKAAKPAVAYAYRFHFFSAQSGKEPDVPVLIFLSAPFPAACSCTFHGQALKFVFSARQTQQPEEADLLCTAFIITACRHIPNKFQWPCIKLIIPVPLYQVVIGVIGWVQTLCCKRGLFIKVFFQLLKGPASVQVVFIFKFFRPDPDTILNTAARNRQGNKLLLFTLIEQGWFCQH